MILRIIFVWVLITFSYLIYSCVSTTANRSLKAWKRQPGTSTYSSPEHNIKVTFPNDRWRIYTGPEEGPPYVKKSWKKYKSKHETYHGLMAIHPDGGGIIMHLKIIPSEQPVFKRKLEDLMAPMRDVYEMRLQQQGGRLDSFESKVIQRQNRRMAVAELQYYAQKDFMSLLAAIKERDRCVWFEFNCEKGNYESKKGEFWNIIDSYERIEKDQYEQAISDTEKDVQGLKRDLTATSSFSKGYEYIGTWNQKTETRTFTNFDHHIKLTFPNKRWLVYTRPQETPDLIKDIWKKDLKGGCPGRLLVAVLLDKKIFMHLLILPNGPPFTKPVTLEQHIDYMTKYIGAGRSEYMVKSKISQLPGGSRVGIITFRLKDKQPASWLYAYLEEKDRFVWFTFMSYKATPMNWNVSECWDIIRSYEYYGKPIYDQAIKDYNRSQETEPRNAEIYFARGNNNAKIGQYDQAIYYFSKAIDINPRFAFAYHNRGKAYAIKGHYDKAIADYNKAIEINPKNSMTYNAREFVRVIINVENYAILLKEKSRDTEAKKIEERAESLFKSFSSSEDSYYLGFAPSEVLREYSTLLRQEGDGKKAEEMNNLADWWDQANRKAAEQAIEKYKNKKIKEPEKLLPGKKYIRPA